MIRIDLGVMVFFFPFLSFFFFLYIFLFLFEILFLLYTISVLVFKGLDFQSKVKEDGSYDT